MFLSLSLFFIGLMGIALNRKNLITILISIEILLLSVSLLFLNSSLILDDFTGQIFGLFIICVAGAETAIGLGIVVVYYRLRGNILLSN